MDRQEQLLELIAKQLEQQSKALEVMDRQQVAMKEMATKTPASGPTFTELHGDGSLFGSQPIERDVITAHVRPRGLGSILPAIPTVFENPRYATLTGYTATNGSNATNPCDDNPQGYVKACNLTAQFGRVAFDTQTIEINKVMLRRNRGDFTDLMLRGKVLAGADIGSFMSPNIDDKGILNIVTKSEMVTVGVAHERALSEMLWRGTPANNTAGGGYKEFPGLDNQIVTGVVDADTNTACPALDSDVKDFTYEAVDSVNKDIVEYVSMMYYYLSENARGMGLDPVTWVLVMRPQLFYELTAVWACRYLSDRCTDNANNVIATVNDATGVAMRDAMRNGLYLTVNGVNIPVVLDHGIFEHNNINNGNLLAGEYASSIYFVPLKITGNFPVTYVEHVDYRAAMPDINLLPGGIPEFWTDDGRFYWAYEGIKWCFKLSAKTEPRVILRTPQLAGKIENVKYSPLQHTREPYPDSAYFADGGVSLRADETRYASWL